MAQNKQKIKYQIEQPKYITRDAEQYNRLMKRGGLVVDDVTYRRMLDLISPRDYVESWSTEQGGNVIAIIRDLSGLPVCVEVEHGGKQRDYISVDRINFWEQWTFVPGYGCYSECDGEMVWEWEE